MGFTGLSAFKQRSEKTSYSSPYWKPVPGKDGTWKGRIRPLAELDEDGKNFDGKTVKTANFVKEYTNPVKFWLKIVDTYPTEEKCVGFEMTQKFGWYAKEPKPDKKQHNDKRKNWNPTDRFYLPVLVEEADGSTHVEVMQLSYNEKSWAYGFVSFYEAKGSITDRWWNLVRKGSGQNDTSYSLTPDDPEDFDFKSLEIPDVSDEPYVSNVPYDEQREFLKIDETYGNDTKSFTASNEDTSSASSSDDSGEDDDW